MNTPTNKRSYTPSVDEIRQYNVKRCKLFSSFGSLSLDGTRNSSSKSSLEDITISNQYPRSKKRSSNVEIIDDIDEYLIQNQTDEEIISSNKQYFVDLPQVNQRSYLSTESSNWADQCSSRAYQSWIPVKYVDPWVNVYKHWRLWYVKNKRFFQFDPSQHNEANNYTHLPNFNYQRYNTYATQSMPKVYELSRDDDQDMQIDDEHGTTEDYTRYDYDYDQVVSNGIVEEPMEEYNPDDHYPRFKTPQGPIRRDIGFNGFGGRRAEEGKFNGDGRFYEIDDDGDCMDVDMDI
ncbi:hypothetical protein WICPIJ_003193 [Wickerhamomyces pijperi]|uniref:Uncharacterized protein n=1 Tax=Wickerhamomyces pijperi TaxID=599730 RepID=A0A9P8TP42_WICPI|nr:hypothetical protein WICPIJ_003193 [Wickerhamomyces pijperi]